MTEQDSVSKKKEYVRGKQKESHRAGHIAEVLWRNLISGQSAPTYIQGRIGMDSSSLLLAPAQISCARPVHPSPQLLRTLAVNLTTAPSIEKCPQLMEIAAKDGLMQAVTGQPLASARSQPHSQSLSSSRWQSTEDRAGRGAGNGGKKS